MYIIMYVLSRRKATCLVFYVFIILPILGFVPIACRRRLSPLISRITR